MRPRMSYRNLTLASLLGLLCLLAAGNAAAVLRSANLGLTQGPATCDGPKGTYTYTATWRDGVGATKLSMQGSSAAPSDMSAALGLAHSTDSFPDQAAVEGPNASHAINKR
jgi:hypothetical protein